MRTAAHKKQTAFQRTVLGAFLAASAIALCAEAATTAIIDDSATVVLDSTPAMSWRSVTPKNRDNAITGRTRVNVRLATATWLGKSARIYMVLPSETSGSVKVAWRGQGLLQDGQLVPGQRALVYSGIIREKRMDDVIDVRVEADGTRIITPQQLRFHFEIDVD